MLHNTSIGSTLGEKKGKSPQISQSQKDHFSIVYQQSTHSDPSERKHKKTTLCAGNQLVILSFTSLRSLIGLEKSHQSLNQSAANKTKPLNFSRHVGCFEFSSTPRDIFLCSDWHSWFSQFYSVNGSVWILHTVSMYWKRHKPVIIQALVDLAALIRPLLNTSFNLGLRTKLLAPPVTEITRLGISRFHLSSINFRMSWTSVSCDTRTYYGYKKRRLGITFAYFGKGYRRKSLTHFHTRAIHDCLPLLYHSSLINIRCLNAPSPRGFIKGQALGKFTSCEDGLFFTWFDHLQKSLSYKEIQFNKFCLPVKTSCPPAENVKETHTLPPPFTPFTNTRTSDKTPQ